MENYTCPICINLLIEPVTLPCKHELCLPCFQQNFEESLCCPMCRTRISSWVRKQSKINKLVNEKRWKEIKTLFPEKVRLRQEGFEEDSEIDQIFQPPRLQLAEPGEIREEYEKAVKKLNEEREAQKQKEEEASVALLNSLREEEERLRREQQKLESQLKKDEELARLLESVGTPALHGKDERVLDSEQNISVMVNKVEESGMIDDITGCNSLQPVVVIEDHSEIRKTSSNSHSLETDSLVAESSQLKDDDFNRTFEAADTPDSPTWSADATSPTLNCNNVPKPNTLSFIKTPLKQFNSFGIKDSERRILFEKKLNVNKKDVGRSRISSVHSKLKPNVKPDPNSKSAKLDLYFSRKDTNHHSGNYFDDAKDLTEEQDRLFALALQKQYDLEFKLSATVNRSKGTSDGYKLRAKNETSTNDKRKRSSSNERVSKKAKT
ncbi:E3 ubiquitin-protein ligase rnf168 [Octopus bimaculoides]|uniref:RING-type E3 ubiquitin transferase n=1 Tax=Octopus bimaculoides TaxID=37653 RepID=A0A0L8GQE8_OCTBM|nr:E3 ubiquitin-protein ligase rnf168 [Octopus bimaculoides]|eukprot:XP_014779017.1 PREDICTED: E3 ubiquitin-protein ligase RNF168-like [Octopus bimaculoides]